MTITDMARVSVSALQCIGDTPVFPGRLPITSAVATRMRMILILEDAMKILSFC